MVYRIAIALACGLWLIQAGLSSAAGAKPQGQERPAGAGRIFDTRTYIAAEGKFNAMEQRFRDHAMRIFKRHGIELIGVWTPVDPEQAKNTLVYTVGFDSVESMKRKWEAFQKDPEWVKIKTDSEKDGPLIGKMISEVRRATDYSPLK